MSLLGTDWATHARRSRKHCKACAKHAHAPRPRARARLHGIHSVGNSNQHLPVRWTNNFKQQRDGRRWNLEETTNYKLLGKGWATRAPVSQTLQSVRKTSSCLMHTCSHTLIRFPLASRFKPTSQSGTVPYKKFRKVCFHTCINNLSWQFYFSPLQFLRFLRVKKNGPLQFICIYKSLHTFFSWRTMHGSTEASQ